MIKETFHMELLKIQKQERDPPNANTTNVNMAGRYKPVPGSVVGSAQTQRKSWDDPTGYTHMHFPLGSPPHSCPG